MYRRLLPDLHMEKLFRLLADEVADYTSVLVQECRREISLANGENVFIL